MDETGKVILLHDFYEHRDQKAKELKFYEEQMDILQEKMALIRAELNLTSRIISMIKAESVEIISSVFKRYK